MMTFELAAVTSLIGLLGANAALHNRVRLAYGLLGAWLVGFTLLVMF